MTCIIGVEFGGKVFLGGDIQGTGGNNKIVHTQPKVFHKKNIIIGYTTSYRFGQILEHHLPDPVIPEDSNEIYRWVVSVLVPSIKNVLKEHGYEDGGNCLIGIRDQLWDMQEDFSVLRSVNGYSACGSGQEYALGSMCVLMRDKVPGIKYTYDACKSAITESIRVTSIFCPSVGSESVIIST